MASIPSNGWPRLHRRAATGVVTAALCAGLVTGCGGSSKASGSGAATTVVTVKPIDLPADAPQKPACGLATGAEVEAAIGAKVSPGKEEAQATRSVCSFSVVGKPAESVVLISTSSSGVPAFVTAAQKRTEGAQGVSAGDQAFVSGPQGLVRRGHTMVAILVSLRQAPAQLTTAATKLAQAVGARL